MTSVGTDFSSGVYPLGDTERGSEDAGSETHERKYVESSEHDRLLVTVRDGV
jgi:hypothetical protein